ncbi:MAG: ABC transporter ATP-binding protein [Lachnospiraceae bacterium]|nr:ABC transporter ATP-binding protein [Lachnospiraceae bacterium]
MEKALSLSHVTYTYHTSQGETKAVDDITFDVKKGEFSAIVGPSGCGKSTLLHLIANLLTPSRGNILIKGRPVSLVSENIGYMLQRDQLLEHRTIYQNITLGLEIQKKVTKKNLERINEMLEQYGLYDFRHVYPRQLSGGMRQRVALIRTLALSPELLLLDEPFSALDYQTRLKVSDDIGTIIKTKKITAILVTHDLSEAISMADRVIVLSSRPGRIKTILPIHFAIKPDSPEAARNAPEFKDYFNRIWKEIKNE